VSGITFGRRPPAVGTADLPALGLPWRRTAVIRLVLAILVVGLALEAVNASRGLRALSGGLLPAGTSAIIVLDLSQSVAPDYYREITDTLKEMIRSNRPVGLVVFSDSPYEMVPPGSPGTDLKPLLPFFTPLHGSTKLNPLFLIDPWQDTFRGGTRISTGLALARDIIRQKHMRHGSVLLISDLDTAATDVPALTEELLTYRRERLPLRLMGLEPQKENRFFFERLVGKGAFDDRPIKGGPDAFTRHERVLSTAVPAGLLALSLLLLTALAAHELWGGRLPLPPRTQRGEA
jgi:hypothetical protein